MSKKIEKRRLQKHLLGPPEERDVKAAEDEQGEEEGERAENCELDGGEGVLHVACLW